MMLDSAMTVSEDLAGLLGGSVMAVLPVGAMEQHGPHLPLTTDTILATGVARRIAEGKTERETTRCIKRFIARRVWRLLEHPERT